MQHFRSQIVPFDSGTKVYWTEDEAGHARDIRDEDVPEGALVIDVTYEQQHCRVRKMGGTFVDA